MTSADQERFDTFMAGLIRRNPGEAVFHQAVGEVAADVIPFISGRKEYCECMLLERLTEADRVIIFRVTWEDDAGQVQVNRGYRVQHSNAIGPYKGGLRFNRDLTLADLKFLAFEQTLKNSLTGLPMGGAKGGANFDPRGRSDREIMRFCQAFMSELWRHIGENTDVPAGDIGVGAREISYLFGQYKRMANRFSGVLTGKGLAFGGSLIRTEATGYGLVYMADNALRFHDQELDGKSALVSGSGNVALHTVEKLLDFGVRVLAVSDSGGFVHLPEGINREQLAFLKELKLVRRGRLDEFADEFGVEYRREDLLWRVPADLAFPCATQNEIDGDEARSLLRNGVKMVAEGANMPATAEAVEAFQNSAILYLPSKAANAGGVAVSGLEMTQNSMRLSWGREELDEALRNIIADIHEQCLEYGKNGERVNYVRGANIAGFVKVAEALLACGVV